jgi:hypothetical protein
MANDKDVISWQVNEIVGATGKPETVEAFLIAKLGNSAGRRTYKELVAFAKEKMRATAGDPAVLLGVKGGQIVGIQEIS